MELRDISNDVLSLEKFLISNASRAKSSIWKGADWPPLLGEVAAGDGKKGIVGQSQQAYQEAFWNQQKEMQPTHTVRLGLALFVLLWDSELPR